MSQANNISFLGSAPAQDPFILLWFLLFFTQPMISGSVGPISTKFSPKSPKPRSLDDKDYLHFEFSFVRARRVKKHPPKREILTWGFSLSAMTPKPIKISKIGMAAWHLR